MSLPNIGILYHVWSIERNQIRSRVRTEVRSIWDFADFSPHARTVRFLTGICEF